MNGIRSSLYQSSLTGISDTQQTTDAIQQEAITRSNADITLQNNINTASNNLNTSIINTSNYFAAEILNVDAVQLNHQLPTYYLDLANHTGTLTVAKGGTGTSSLTANKILCGNGTGAILQLSNLHWDTTNLRLGLKTSSPAKVLDLQSGTAQIHNSYTTTDPNAGLLQLYNANTTSTGNTILSLKTNGLNSGDPYISYDIAGQNGYSMGVDNSDGDKWKLMDTYNFIGNSIITADRATDRVGIMNSNPSQALDITGSVQYSSQLISTITTGTAPFSIASTTLNTNLNADLLDGHYSSYYLNLSNQSNTFASNQIHFGDFLQSSNLSYDDTTKIMSISDTAKLQFSNSVDTFTFQMDYDHFNLKPTAILPGAGSLMSFTSNSVAFFGTASTATPFSFNVGGTMTALGLSLQDMTITQNTILFGNIGSSNDIKFRTNITTNPYDAQIQHNSTGIHFYGAYNRNDITILKSNANVGIHNSNPTYPVDIKGIVRVSSNYLPASPSSGFISCSNSSNNVNAHAISGLQVNGAGGGNAWNYWDIAGVSGFSLGIDNGDADKLKLTGGWDFVASPTILTVIRASGNVGINTTAPSEKLEVSGVIKANHLWATQSSQIFTIANTTAPGYAPTTGANNYAINTGFGYNLTSSQINSTTYNLFYINSGANSIDFTASAIGWNRVKIQICGYNTSTSAQYHNNLSVIAYDGTTTISVDTTDRQTLGKADAGGSLFNWFHSTFTIEFIFNVVNTSAYIKPVFASFQDIKSLHIMAHKL